MEDEKKNYGDIVPKTRDYAEKGRGSAKKKNYGDIVPRTRSYVEEGRGSTKAKNYNDIVPKTRSYIPKPPIDNPFYKNPIYDPSKPDEIIPAPLNPVSPEQAERIEQNLYNKDQEILTDILDQPDTRTSPDDPEEHKQHVENKERAAQQARTDEVMDMLAKNFHFDRAGGTSDRMTVPAFIQAGLEYGHSPEKLIAEMSKPENAEYFELIPLSQAERSGDPLDFIRMQREAAARTALESE